MTGTDPGWRGAGFNDQCVKVRSLLRFPYGIAPKNTSGDIPGNDVLSCTRSVLDINTRSGEKLAM